MQYEKSHVTKVSVRSDMPTSISSSQHGANLNAVAFNLDFIALRRPQLAVELLRLHREARDLTDETPLAPDEDFLAADERLQAQLRQNFKRHQ